MKALKVLVTRPVEQGKRLAEALTQEGFQPLLSPMLQIEPLGSDHRANLITDLNRIASCDGVIAISANAFAFAREIIQQENISIPEYLQWFAVGGATAESMRLAGFDPVIPESKFDTEGLLDLTELTEVQNKKFVMLAGRGGRKKLEVELRERGAHIDRIELYQRSPLPASDISVSSEPDVIIAMSGETLESLEEYISSEGLHEWFGKPLMVPSARVAEQAFDVGFKNVRVSENASEKSLLQALCRLASEV